ncbi:MAG: hypothetical protein WA294_04110, partial [Acidobacteriaceae bacterium]
MAFALAGCHGNQNQTTPQDQSAAQPSQAQSTEAQPAASDDPASANLAPATDVTETGGQQNPPAPPADQSAQPSESQSQGAENQNQESAALPPPQEQENDGETTDNAAPQPPPEIPDYEQPPAPEPNYIWTPGYWAYAPAGYYWVPGAWVMPPYTGVLWTPGYWGFGGGRYHWYHGYWGPHVGFYGGVNYGFGYGGFGYEGGYWRNNTFFYNTTVCRVNTTVIRNVYSYRVVNRFNTTRVAYVGGQGGLRYRPSPAQLAAWHEPHVAALPAQREIVQVSVRNHAQFENVNHGRPVMVAENRPLNNGRTAPAPPPPAFREAIERGRPAEAPAAHPSPAER